MKRKDNLIVFERQRDFQLLNYNNLVVSEKVFYTHERFSKLHSKRVTNLAVSLSVFVFFEVYGENL